MGATTGGSRNAVFGGGAARQAALEMRERVFQIAAHMLEASPDDLDMDGGVVSVRGTPSAQKTLAEVAHLAYMTPKQLPDRRAARARDRLPLHHRRAHLVQRRPHLHLRGRSPHRPRHAAPLHRERRLRRPHQPERRRGPDRRRRGAGDRRGALRALRLRRRRQPDHHHLPRLPAARPPPTSRCWSTATSRPPPPAPAASRGWGRAARSARRPRSSTRSPTRSAPLGVVLTDQPLTPRGPRAGHLEPPRTR